MNHTPVKLVPRDDATTRFEPCEICGVRLHEVNGKRTKHQNATHRTPGSLIDVCEEHRDAPEIEEIHEARLKAWRRKELFGVDYRTAEELRRLALGEPEAEDKE